MSTDKVKVRALQTEKGQMRYVVGSALYLIKEQETYRPFSDRGQPSCGWCSRNDQICEYKERKKPGLRAGYGRELEQRLGK